MMRSVAALGACVPAHADTEIARGAMGAFAYDEIVTNLGVLSLPARVGALRVDPFWGPFVRGLFRNEIVIGTAALGDQYASCRAVQRISHR